jgi:hypothetical protein
MASGRSMFWELRSRWCNTSRSPAAQLRAPAGWNRGISSVSAKVARAVPAAECWTVERRSRPSSISRTGPGRAQPSVVGQLSVVLERYGNPELSTLLEYGGHIMRRFRRFLGVSGVWSCCQCGEQNSEQTSPSDTCWSCNHDKCSHCGDYD